MKNSAFTVANFFSFARLSKHVLSIWSSARRKSIRSGEPDVQTDGGEDAFNHPVSGNRSTLVFLPRRRPTHLLAAGTIGLPPPGVFPAGVPLLSLSLSFFFTVINTSDSPGQFESGWELECEARLSCASVIILLQSFCNYNRTIPSFICAKKMNNNSLVMEVNKMKPVFQGDI